MNYGTIANMPIIPDSGWVNLATVANAMGGHPDPLISAAERLGLDMHSGRGWPSIQARDLDALVGPQWARTIRYGSGPEFCSNSAAASILGVSVHETIALCERRGVAVLRTGGGTPTISRSGAIILHRLLERERSAPIAEGDLLAGVLALPAIRARQTTIMTGEWPTIDVTDPDAPWVDPDSELVARCGWLAIRWKRERTGRSTFGRIAAVGFDLYRLLGIDSLPGQDLAAYRDTMAIAWEQVVGPIEPVPVAAAG